jgi:hypothetical protein
MVKLGRETQFRADEKKEGTGTLHIRGEGRIFGEGVPGGWAGTLHIRGRGESSGSKGGGENLRGGSGEGVQGRGTMALPPGQLIPP